LAHFPDDVLDAIRQAVDLPELIGRYVPLKRSGGKSFKACCPFHQEKTPSFTVTPERGTWKCFGCGKGGNCFHFLMEKEGLRFPEAVRQLAKQAGVALPGDDPGAAAEAARLDRLREVMERACLFFEKALRSAEGQVAREYLTRRGICEDTARRFRLGWALPGWQHLIEAAQKAGIRDDDLVELGLARRKEAEEGRAARFFDMFRGRVTFPICDTQGRVVAFGARTLGDDEPKYLNSPETPLFHKGRTVYALHLAKQEMLKTGEGAVMEGYTDVILAHQCGWPVAVAGLGTALTREQASLVARYVKRLHLVYDGDAAGLKAAEKNAPTFLPEPIETRVVVLPVGEDPCDTLIRGGLPALRACVDAGREAFDHLLAAKAAAGDMTTVPGKAQALDAALEALVPVTDELRRALYIKSAADRFTIPEEIVWNRLREMRSSAQWKDRKPPPPLPPVAPASAADAEAPPPPRPVGPPPPAEEHLVEAMLGRPELAAEAAERLPAEALSHPHCRELFARIVAAWEATGSPPRMEAVLSAVEDGELASFAAGLVARGLGKDLLGQGRDCLARLVARHEADGLRQGLGALDDPSAQRREMRPEEGDMLRRWVEFHRRRATPG
jgi:DNA primase